MAGQAREGFRSIAPAAHVNWEMPIDGYRNGGGVKGSGGGGLRRDDVGRGKGEKS